MGTLAWQLRPGILDDLGLRRALEALCNSLQAHSPSRIVLNQSTDMSSMPAELELALYRVAQEALTNAVRHGQARTIVLTLSGDPQLLTLHVADDGSGIGPGTEEGAGIRGMRERALLIGGHISVKSRPGHGVTVHLELSAAEQGCER